MRRVVFGVALVVGATLVATEGEAQASDWWDWALAEEAGLRYGDDRYDRDPYGYDRDRRDRDRYDDYRRGEADLGGALIDIILGRRGDDRVYRRDRRNRRSPGPAFCRRGGRGHPVHGRSWCRQKGWDDYGRRRGVWHRRGGWGDIILRTSRIGHRRTVILDRRGLADILGEVILQRLIRDAYRDTYRGRGDDLRGRWMTPRRGVGVLQVRSAAGPVAELTDANGDGRVDVVLVPGYR